MSLTLLWAEYKKIELKGKRNDRAIELEELIHTKQKSIGSPPYDFDVRWERKEIRSKSTLSGPPPADSKPQEDKPDVSIDSIDIEDVRKRIGKNDCRLLDGCARWADDRLSYLSYVLETLNPENRNPARRGQGSNIALGKFVRDKVSGS